MNTSMQMQSSSIHTKHGETACANTRATITFLERSPCSEDPPWRSKAEYASKQRWPHTKWWTRSRRCRCEQASKCTQAKTRTKRMQHRNDNIIKCMSVLHVCTRDVTFRGCDWNPHVAVIALKSTRDQRAFEWFEWKQLAPYLVFKGKMIRVENSRPQDRKKLWPQEKNSWLHTWFF